MVNAKVPLNRDTGACQGFGFVTYSDESEADNAIQNGPHLIDGKEVRSLLTVFTEEGLVHAEGAPTRSCLRQVESYLEDTRMAGLASAWVMARRRPI